MVDDILRRLFPGQDHRYFLPMKIGSTRQGADESASLILAGIKTATSTPHWHFPAGCAPFAGALSVVLDGSDTPRGVVETERVENLAFLAVDATFALAYGEGPRTLEWWRSEIGDWYRADAARCGEVFDADTIIVCEWFRLVRRLDDG
ncbi:MAG: ASCH domain-containing protein [Hyphomicrobiaceae bacterium]